MAFLLYFIFTLIPYLFLTAGSGVLFGLWSIEEIIAGFLVSIFTSLFAWKILPHSLASSLFNPFKWILFIIYAFTAFFVSLLVANIEVIYRVITGRISPAVIKLETGYKSNLGAFLLANSITLSPGTLSLELDEKENSIYIHCLNWKKSPDEAFEPKEAAPFVHYWLKKIYG